MGRHDWYRNTEWSVEIESAFQTKLKRARDKAQYLRIQAYTLRPSRPEICLELLDQYFALAQHFEDAMAYEHQAEAYRELGKVELALASYRKTLEREAEFPNVRTQAYLDLPLFVADQKIFAEYDASLRLLESHKSWPKFAVEHFKHQAALALIESDRGNNVSASQHASNALKAAAVKTTGLTHHPTFGTVGEGYANIRLRLQKLIPSER